MDLLLILNSVISQLTDPNELIRIGGFVLILVIIYLETGFFLGLILPGGDYLVFTAGVVCGTYYLDIPFSILLPSMMASAILGDFTGYAKGWWLGPKLFNKEETRYFKRSHLEKTKAFYEKYGMLAFIAGRFLPVVRTLIPILAGASKVKFAKFILFNVTGAVIWIGTLAPIGYFLGREYPGITDYSIYLMLGFFVIASFPVIKFWLFSNRQAPPSDKIPPATDPS